MNSFTVFFKMLSIFLLSSIFVNVSNAATIEGTVMDINDTELDFVNVSLQTNNDGYWYTVEQFYTRNDGRYIFLNVPIGEYRLSTYKSGYLNRYYNNVENRDNADYLSVSSDDQILSSIDFTLNKLGEISGVVEDINGLPLKGITLSVYRFVDGSWDYINFYRSDYSNGSYSIDYLQPGEYTFKTGSDGDSTGTEYYNNAQSLETADKLSIEVNQNKKINIVLGDITSSSIEGKITNIDNSSLNNVVVTLYKVITDNNNNSYLNDISETTTDMNGNYNFNKLLLGNYTVGISNYQNPSYQDKFWGTSATEIMPYDVITLSEGENLKSANIILDSLGLINVTVLKDDGITASADSSVVLYEEIYEGYWSASEYQFTDLNGSYSFIVNPNSKYRIKSYEDRHFNSEYSEYYDNAFVIEDAKDINVALNQIFEANITLGGIALSSISGRITDINNQPIESAYVKATRFNSDGELTEDNVGDVNKTVLTDSNGFYTISNLNGKYLISTSKTNYISNFTINENVVVIDTSIGENIVDISFTLDKYGSLSGTIKDEVGNLLRDTFIILYEKIDEEWIRRINSYANDGNYSFDELTAGVYALKFESYNTSSYEFYNDQYAFEDVEEITVKLNDTSTANAVLGNYKNTVISGKVTYIDNQLYSYSSLRIDKLINGEWETTYFLTTDGQGQFSIDNAEAGKYRLRVDYVDQGYALPDPMIFNVEVNKDHNNINILIEKEAILEGIIKDVNGNIINSVSVLLYRTIDNEIIQSYDTYSDNNGAYSFNGLSEGDYKIEFFDVASDASQFANGRKDIDDANVISIDTGQVLNLNFQFFKTINGFVKDKNGKPLTDVSITAFTDRDDGFGSVQSTSTDQNGYYAFSGLDTGSYTFKFDNYDEGITKYLGNSDNLDDALRIIVIATEERPLDFQFVSRAINQPESIPTLNEWSLILLAFSLFILSFYSSRNRRRKY